MAKAEKISSPAVRQEAVKPDVLSKEKPADQPKTQKRTPKWPAEQSLAPAEISVASLAAKLGNDQELNPEEQVFLDAHIYEVNQALKDNDKKKTVKQPQTDVKDESPKISISSLADKVSKQENLSAEEQAVFNDHTREVWQLVRENDAKKLAQQVQKIQSRRTQGISPVPSAGSKKDKSAAAAPSPQPAASPTPSQPAAKQKLVFEAGAVDVTALAKQKARQAAGEQMTAEKKELSGVFGFFKKIFKYGYGEQVLHEKKRLEAKDKIVRENNLYANEAMSAEEKESSHRRSAGAIIGRFLSKARGIVEADFGERRQEVSGNTKEEQLVKTQLKQIIDDFAEGKLDEAAFEGAKRQVFASIRDMSLQNKLDNGEVFVDNFLDIAKQVKQLKEQMAIAAGHSVAMDQLEYDINLVLGVAKSGLKTEAQYSRVERTIEKLRKTKLGSLVNETTLALGVAGAASVLTGFGKIAASRTAAFVTFGLSAGVAGVFAAVKESQMQKRERETLELREASGTSNLSAQLEEAKLRTAHLTVALERTADKQEKKRLQRELKASRQAEKKLEAQNAFLYNRCRAQDLIGGLDAALKQDNYDAILSQLAELESRRKISQQRHLDLWSYSRPDTVEEERRQILELRAAAFERLKELDQQNQAKVSAENRLEELVKEKIKQLVGGKSGIEEKDEAFKNHKDKAVLNKLVTQALAGITVGVVAQEAFSLISDNQEGLVENLVKGSNRPLGARDTVLQAMRNYIGGGAVSEQLKEHAVQNGLVKLPAGCSWLANSDGSYSLARGGDILADNLHLNPNGSFSAEAKSVLAGSGIQLSEQSVFLDGPSTGGADQLPVSPEKYIEQHPEYFKSISREYWYGNDTPMYQGADGRWYGADLNELRFDWGGPGGTGINEQCNAYELSAMRMTADGSFQTINGERLSDNAKELLASGKLKVLFTLSDGTQNRVIELPIDRYTGLVQVDRSSELGQLLFTEDNGRAVLKARFMEVAMVSGNLEDGTQQVRVFATAVGEGLKEAPGAASLPVENTVTTLGLDRAAVLPPFIPIDYRRPLEPVAEVYPAPIYNFYNGQFADRERRQEMDRRRCSELERDPLARLDEAKVINDYLKKLDKKYLREIEKLATQAGSMSDNNIVSVCIPVAGHQEGGKIYNSLKNYTNQSADPETFELCLLVNHPDKDRSGNKVELDNTLEEIERFKSDFPQFNVRVMYVALPIEKAKIGLVRKLLSDAVLLRQQQRGQGAKELIMVSNDADNLGIDPRYIQNFVNRFANNPELDGILGQIDWDPEAYVKHPLIHVGTRLFQYYSAYGRTQRGGVVSSGANYAYRASIYAGVGGYLDNEPGGEDVALGQAIALARGNAVSGERGYNFETQRHGGSASRLFTSARRAIDVLKKHGLAPIEQWNKTFSAFDDLRKDKLQDEIVNYDDNKWLAGFKSDLEVIINRTLDEYEKGEKLGKNHHFYRKYVVGPLGIKYDVDSDGRLVITDMSQLIQGLRRYQKEGVLRRDARSGQPGAKESLDDFFMREKIEEENDGQLEKEQDVEVAQKNETELIKFYSENKLNFQIKEADLIVPKKSRNEKLSVIDGEYLRRDKTVISDTENSLVVAGYDNADKKTVVIKEIDYDKLKNKDIEDILIQQNLKIPGLLLPKKSFVRDGRSYRIYSAAQTDILRYAEKQPQGRLNTKDALSVIIRMADVTGELHKLDIVHGDIHPGNIYIFEDGVKLGDLDEAYVKDYYKRGLSGNRFIMAPEMFADEIGRRFNKSVDIYALSASLYKMLTGNWPHEINEQGLSVDERQEKYHQLHLQGKVSYPEDFPAALKPIIDKGMNPDPSQRYKNINYFLNDLLSAYNSI